MLPMNDAFICDAVRTPIGRYGGALAAVRTDDLAAVPIRALLARNPTLDPSAVEEVLLGCANQAGEDNRNVARMALLLAGLPVSVAGATINRLCGSGLDALAMGARAIRVGEAQLVIAGGVESMSRAPFVMPKADAAFSRDAQIYDTTIGWRFVNPRLREQYGIDSMPETGENVAAQFHIARADQDRFALRSQQRAAAAAARGFFAHELVPVAVPQKKGAPLQVSRDEHPRPQTTLEQLASLPAPFRAGGTVTAGNASGINDGACALLVASASAAARLGLTPRARVVAAATAGVEPRIMGMGPVPATRKVLAVAGLTLGAARRDRAERGVREPGARRAARARPARRCRAREPERRRDRARSPARHVRRAPRGHRDLAARGTAAAATRCAPCASASGRASR